MQSNKRFWEKDKNWTIILSCLVLFLTGIMFFIIQYYQLLRGDDVLFQYEHSHYWYTELKQWRPAEKIANISMLINEVWERWLYFSGRFSTVIFVPVLNIFGQGICSVIGSVIYTLFIICMGRIIWGSWKEVFQHPIGLFIIFLLQFQLSPTASYMNMWTFVCHYSMPIVLCMLYYIFWDEGQKVNFPPKLLFILNLGGICVGATHELLPLYCFILIGVKGLIIYKKFFFKPLFISNIGIVLGYLFVFIAPGNFIRMGIEHDIRRVETGFLEKMYISLKSHIRALGLENLFVKIFLLYAIAIICVSIYKNSRELKEIFINNLEFVIAAMLSVLLWAVVAPPVAQYSMPFFKAIVIILILRMLDLKIEYTKKYLFLTGAIIGIWMFMNITWCSDLIETTIYRRTQIEMAIEEGKSEVILEDYPESTANYFTSNNVANSLGAYDPILDADFYGVRIMTTEDVDYSGN